ncbi:MAG: T9SS type A sorting domain-containing protein [Bacteroidota bacterium]
MIRTLGLLLLLFFSEYLPGQTSFCPDDPPLNPFLAESPWPIYHRNNYAQSSTCLRGPEAGDSLRVIAKTGIQGSTSPWTYLSDSYPNGERVLIQSNATHFFKITDQGGQLETVDSIRIDFDPITSFGWNFLQLPDKVWFTYDSKYEPENNRYPSLYRIEDVDSSDPYSPLEVVDTFSFQELPVGVVQHFSINYAGQITFVSNENEATNATTIGLLNTSFELLDTLELTLLPGEITFHNAQAIDENNSIYLVTTHRMIRFDWDGEQLSIGWEVPYDFVADGPTGSFAEGSGTTPTLMGWGAGQDQLVVVADGHANNNLVAFWREIPDDWMGIPGEELRLAGKIQLPAAAIFSNLFQSIENSPCVSGYEIAVAQFNGFLGQDCPTIKGVQKLHWDTIANEWVLDWVNTDINMNGVLTYSRSSDLVYGAGRADDCNYYYYALNWSDGSLSWDQYIGPEGSFTNNPWDDGGNNHIIAESGDIYFSGGASLVKIEIVSRNSSSSNTPLIARRAPFTLYPNPASRRLQLALNEDISLPARLIIRDSSGRRRTSRRISGSTSQLNFPLLKPGVYVAELRSNSGQILGVNRFIITD